MTLGSLGGALALRHAANHRRVSPTNPLQQLPPTFLGVIGWLLIALVGLSVIGVLLEDSGGGDSSELIFVWGMVLLAGVPGLLLLAWYLNAFQQFFDDRVEYRTLFRRTGTIRYRDIASHHFVTGRAGNPILTIRGPGNARLRIHLQWTDATPLLDHLGVVMGDHEGESDPSR